jgi:hypothetical protein
MTPLWFWEENSFWHKYYAQQVACMQAEIYGTWCDDGYGNRWFPPVIGHEGMWGNPVCATAEFVNAG